LRLAEKDYPAVAVPSERPLGLAVGGAVVAGVAIERRSRGEVEHLGGVLRRKRIVQENWEKWFEKAPLVIPFIFPLFIIEVR